MINYIWNVPRANRKEKRAARKRRYCAAAWYLLHHDVRLLANRCECFKESLKRGVRDIDALV